MRINFQRQVCGEQASLARPQHTCRGALNLGCPRRRNRRVVSAESAPSAERYRSGSNDVVYKNDVAHRIPSCSSAISLEMSANRFLGMAPTTQRSWLTTFASTSISLSFRVVRQAVVLLARSPKPAG